MAMTLEKAIEIKSRTGDEFLATDPEEIDEADRLSIEAMKRIQERRVLWAEWGGPPLPGETPK